ncbi:MAG: DUF4105 domain-containing protein [Polyangiaceae bacterium]|nr:DUF4105 domain-containing protein [Polyangiaceae bacterium]
MFRRWIALAVAIALFVLAPRARAEDGDQYTVSVITFGPGDHPFFKFGHNAILIEEARPRRQIVFNFGTFGFGSWTLLPEFLRGRLSYWLSTSSLERTVRHYRAENRTVDQQVLGLTAAQKRDLVAALRENALPENMYYRYDYYLDNCSTRVRDAIDRVLGGRLRQAAGAAARQSFRDHTLRLTADSPHIYFALDAAMTAQIDQPITVWDEMFLPVRVQETLREVRVPDDAGGERPLVVSERRLVEAPGRAPLRDAPPRSLPYYAGIGVAFGASLLALGRRARRSRSARVLLGALLVPLGLVIGVLGVLFALLWATDHRVAHGNENLLQIVPWALLLVGSGIGVARARPRSIERAYRVATSALVASALGVVLQVLPWFRQENGRVIALMLPLWAGMALGLRALAKPPAPAPPAPGPAEGAA